MNKPEILSPAGSRESLEAAVRSGAGAVYIGATEFSARRNAENFDEQGLKSAVEYCRVRGVRVYLTLNIIVTDRELYEAVNVARAAQRAGVDAVIVQDWGLVKVLREALPQLEIHASTQMSVHSPSALPLLKSLGIKQVVASREMSADGLRELCEEARRLDMKVEVFIHGALCMSVSGQCLMSAVLGGRSGNRGLCAGPCRLAFGVEGGTGYDLSLKDLSLLDHLGCLAEMGVSSFKIEGRMKRPEYVAAATAAARAALDNGCVPEWLSSALRNVFSRSGFTDGYYTEKLGKDMFGIRTKEDVVSAKDAFAPIHELYRTEYSRVPLKITAEILKDKPIKLTLSDGFNTAAAEGVIPDKAQNKALTQETVKTALSKLGGTPYFAETVDVALDEGLFLRNSDLNALRREAIEKLDGMRAVVQHRAENEIKLTAPETHTVNNTKIIIRVENVDQIPENKNGIDTVIFPLENQPPENITDDVKWAVDVPRGIVSEKILRERLKLFKERGFTLGYCGNIAALKILREQGFEVIGGVGMNVYNCESIAVLREWGMNSVTVSPEADISYARQMPSVLPKGIFAYGRLPLMLTRNCPVKNGRGCKECDRNAVITDRKGISFPVRCRMGFSEVLNSVPIYLADRMDEIGGLDFWLLYFTDETPNEVKRIISCYKTGSPPPNEYTRGLYYRTTL